LKKIEGSEGMRDPICSIDLLKEGIEFIARTELPNGDSKEYRSSVLEDLLTQVMIDLEEKVL
jgi:hypothetical protein